MPSFPFTDVGFKPTSAFNNHVDFATAQSFELSSALGHLKKQFSPFGSLTSLQKPASVSDTLPFFSSRGPYTNAHYCGFPSSSSSALTHPISTPRSRIRTGLICAGVVSERVFLNQSWFSNVFDICLVCQRNPDKLQLSRRIFPHARHIADARSLLKSLRLQPLQLDLLVCSFPCTDERPQQDLYDYPPTTTADLFRGHLRFQLMDDTGATMVVDENVPPHAHYWQHHDTVRLKARAHGLHSRVFFFDVANVGTATSRERWIHFSSRFLLPAHIDIAQLSGMSSFSRPVSEVLEPAGSNPSDLWITDSNVARGVHADALHNTRWNGSCTVDHATVHIAMRTYTYPSTATLPPHTSEHLVHLSCALPTYSWLTPELSTSLPQHDLWSYCPTPHTTLAASQSMLRYIRRVC